MNRDNRASQPPLAYWFCDDPFVKIVLPSNHHPIGCNPQPQDVLCGRKELAFNQAGNKEFHKTSNMHLKQYNADGDRFERGGLSDSVVGLIQSRGSHFLKRESSDWVVSNGEERRGNIADAARDETIQQQKPTTKWHRKEGGGSEHFSQTVDEPFNRSAKRTKTVHCSDQETSATEEVVDIDLQVEAGRDLEASKRGLVVDPLPVDAKSGQDTSSAHFSVDSLDFRPAHDPSRDRDADLSDED